MARRAVQWRVTRPEECHLPRTPPASTGVSSSRHLPRCATRSANRGGTSCHAEQRGSVFKTRDGYGIRWPENGKRPQRTGFPTKTEARELVRRERRAAARPGAPDPTSPSTRSATCSSSATAPPSPPAPRETLEERLAPARERFGDWTLRELEGATADIAAWRAEPARRRRATGSRRRCGRRSPPPSAGGTSPATRPSTPGRNPQPRAEELLPFTVEEIDALAVELGPAYGPLVVFAAETGLRTNEWVALERRDVDRAGRAVTVQRRYADGVLTPFPKTAPLTPARAAHRAGAGRARRAAAEARHAAAVPRRRRAGTSASTTGAPASGTRRSKPPGSRSAARTTCATRSRPRRSPPASRPSSWPG